MLALILGLILSSPIQHAYDTSVVIVADYLGDDGKMVYGAPVCSGFIIRSDKAQEVIGTAKHCTQDIADRGVLFFDGDHGRVEGIDASEDADVAVLYVHSMRSHPIVQFSHRVNPGDECFLVGMPSADFWSFSSLRSRNGSQVFFDAPDDPALTFEGPGVFSGDSGAAVFDKRGKVIGVLDAGMDPDRPAIVYAAPISYIEDLL